MSSEAAMSVDSASHARNAARVRREEEELRKLMAEARGETNEEPSSDIQQEASEEAPQEASREVEATEEPQEASKAEQKEEPKLSKEEESFKKRYGDLRRHMQEKEQEYKLELEKIKAQLDKSAKNELVLPKSEEEIAAWAKKYPDVAAIVEAIADKKASERSSDLDKRLKEIEELRVQAKKDKAEAELMSLHPDFAEIRSADEFHEWAESQPKWVQDALYENVDDARSVARVIDLYKADKGIVKQKTTSSDKAAASSVNAKTRNTPEADESKSYFRESQVNKMTTKEYEKNADAIMDAIRSGKFVYDVSGKK
jgi:hypothetical protein